MKIAVFVSGGGTNLQAIIDRIESGELGVTVPMRGDDELGELGRAFSNMSRRIEELIDKTYKEELIHIFPKWFHKIEDEWNKPKFILGGRHYHDTKTKDTTKKKIERKL